MEVVPFYDADTGTFSYLIADGGEAAIIDPVLEFDLASGQTGHALADRQIQHASEQGWSILWVLETHAHADHLSAAAYLKQKTGARVGIGRGITEVQRRFSSVYGLGGGFPVDGRQFDRLFDDGEVLGLGSARIRVMATPGHTNDSVTYRVEGSAFIGDTLFMPDFGSARCDFPGGDASLLYDSIQKIYALPDNTCLYMCHDYPKQGEQARCKTTVAESRTSNIHLDAETSREEYVERRRARDAQLSVPRLLLPAIQVNIRAGELPERDANGVSYLRLPIDADLATLADPKD